MRLLNPGLMSLLHTQTYHNHPHPSATMARVALDIMYRSLRGTTKLPARK